MFPNTSLHEQRLEAVLSYLLDARVSTVLDLGCGSAPLGLRSARRHLATGGVLGVWSWAESSSFSRTLRHVFNEVRVEPVTFFNDMVDEERTDWLLLAR